MTSKIALFILGLSLSVAINAACVQSSEIDTARARELIRRNILGGNELFSIKDPRVYQYGSVHVDGPSGGMLYRFQANSDILYRIIKRKRLEKTTIDSSAEWPIDFLKETPKWWKPHKADEPDFYSVSESISTGGKQRFILIHDRESNVIYIVEHYSEMRGV